MNYKSILPEIFQNNDAETFISNYGDYLQGNTVNSTFFEYNPDPTFVDSHILLNEQNIDIENKYRIIPYSTKLNYCYNNTLEKRSKGTIQNIKYVYKTNFGKSIEIVRPNSGMYQEHIGSAIELLNLDSSIPNPSEFANLSGKNILQDGITIGKIKTLYYDEEVLKDLLWLDVLTSSVQENDTVSVGASNKLYKISLIKNVNYYNWTEIKNRYVDENGRYVSNNENTGYNSLLLYNYYKGYNFLRYSFGKKSYLKSTILSESMTLGSIAKKSLSEITSHIDYTYQMCGIDNMLLSGFVSPFEITSKYLNLTILDFSKQINQIFLNYGSSLTGFKASNLQLTDSVLAKQDFSLLSIIGRLDGYMLVDGKVFLDSGYMNDVSSIQNYRISESNINILNYSNVSAGFSGNSNKTFVYNNEKLFVISEFQNSNIFGHYSSDLIAWHALSYTSSKTIVDCIQYDDKILFLFNGSSTIIGSIYDITSNTFTDIGVADAGSPNRVSKNGSVIFITNSIGGTTFIGWISLDSGLTWAKVQTNISLTDNLTCSPNGLKVFQNVIFVTLSNTTKYFGLISLNYGKQWKVISYSGGIATSVNQVNNPQINESNIFIYSDESDMIGYYSLDYGLTWNKQINYSGITKGKIINENNKAIIINSDASYNCAIYSVNNGLTWKPIVQEKLNVYISSFFVNDDIWMYSANGDILSNQNKYDDFIVRYNVGAITNPILAAFKNKMLLVSNAPIIDGYSYKLLNIEYSRNGIVDNVSKINYLTINATNFANKDEILNIKANVLFTSLDIAPMNVLYENGTLISSKFYQASGFEFGTNKITTKSKVNYLQTNPTELNGQIYHIAPSFKFKPFKIYDITFAGSVINISTNGVELNDGDTVYINNNGKLKELTLHKVVKTTISTKILKLSVNIEGYGGYTSVNLIITGNSLSGLTVPLDRINSDIANMSYVNNTALALENNAIIESREFVLCSDYYAIKPVVTLTPTLFEIDPASFIGSLKLAFNQNGMLAVGDKLIVEQNGILSSITIIEMDGKFSADFSSWEYVDINNGGTSPTYPLGSILDILSFVGTPTAKDVISSAYNSTSNLDSFDFEFKINPIKSWKIRSTSTTSAVSFISNNESEFYPGDTLLFEQNGTTTPIRVNNVVNSLYGTQMTSTEVIHASTGGRGITYRNSNNELCMYIPAAYNNISALYKLNESNDTFEKVSNVNASVGGGYGEAMVINGVTYFILHNGALSILKLNETEDDVSLVQQMNTLPGVNYMTYDVKCLRIHQTSNEHLIFASVKMSNPFANQEILAFKYNSETHIFDLISQIGTNFGSNHTFLASFDICIYLNEIYLIGLISGSRTWSENYSIIAMYKYSANALTLISSTNPRQGPEFDNIGASAGKITIANKDYVIITLDAYNYFDIYTTNDGLTLAGLPITAPLPKVMYPGAAVCSIKPFMHKGSQYICILSKKANYWSNYDDNYTDLWIYQVNSDLSLTYLFRYDYPYIANNFDIVYYNGDVAVAIGSNTVQATFITNLFNTGYSHLITDTVFTSVPTQAILANQRYYYSTSELAPYKWTPLTDINYSYNKAMNIVTTYGSFVFNGTENASLLKLKAGNINENDTLTQIKAVIRNVPAVNSNNYEKIYSSYYLGNSTVIPKGFYLGGEDGHIYYSANTSAWATLSSRAPNIVTSIVSSPAMIIAFDALGNFSTSTDGTTWTLSSSKISNFRTNDCIYANGKYILVTEGGEVYTSQSGTSWNKSLIKSDYSLNSLCYNAKDKLYIFVGNNGVILTSTDLINSTVRTGTFLNYDITSITTNNSEYVIVGDHGILNTSIDGLAWLDASSGYGDNLLTDVLYANGLFVGVGESRSIVTSENGKDWTLHRNSWVNCGYIESIIYGRGLFVASGYRGGAIKCGTLDTYRTVYTITNPSLSVAVPTWVAKGGQTLHSSCSMYDNSAYSESGAYEYLRNGNALIVNGQLVSNVFGNHFRFKCENININEIVSSLSLSVMSDISIPFDSTTITYVHNAVLENNILHSYNNGECSTYTHSSSGKISEITCSVKIKPLKISSLPLESDLPNITFVSSRDNLFPVGSTVIYDSNGTGITAAILSMAKTVKFFSRLTGQVNRYGNFVKSDAYSNNFKIGTNTYFTFNAILSTNTAFISTYKIDINENLTLVNELSYSSYASIISTDTIVIGTDVYLIVLVPAVSYGSYGAASWEVLKFNSLSSSWEPFKNIANLPYNYHFFYGMKVNVTQCKPIVTSAGYYILFYYRTSNVTLEEVSSGLDINGYVYKWNGTTFVELKRLVTPLEETNSWSHFNYNGTVLHYRVSGALITYAIWDIENEMFGTAYTLSLARTITHASPFINNGHLYFGISTSGNGTSTYDDFETWKYDNISNQFSYLNTIQQNPTSMIDRTTNVVMEYGIPYTINKYVASGNTYAVTRKFDSITETFNMIEYFLYVDAASISLNNIFPFNNLNGKLYIWEGGIGMTGPASIRVITNINRTYHYNTVLENYADTHATIPEYVYIDNKRLYSSVTLDTDPLSYSECIFDSKTIENDIITYNAKTQQANGNKIKLKLTSLIDGEECSAFKFNFTTTEQSSSSTIDYNYSSVDIDNAFTDSSNSSSSDSSSSTVNTTWALGAYPVMKYALTDTNTNSPVFLDFANPVYTRNANDEIEVKYDNMQLNLSTLGEIQSIEPILQSPAYVESSTGFLDTEIKTVYCGNSETLDLIKDEFKNELLIPKSYVINLTDHNRTLYDLIHNSDINYSIAYNDLKLSFVLNTDVSINRRIPIVLRPDNSGTLIKLYFDLNVSRINGINRLVINQELIDEIENTTDSTFSYNLSIWNLLKYGTGLPLIDKGTVQKYLKTISKYSNILITDIQKDIFFELIRNNLVAGINYNFVYKTENSYTGIGTETFSDAITIIG